MEQPQSIAKIDAHHHLWDLDSNPYPWLTGAIRPRMYGDYSAIAKNYLADDFLSESRAHNVVKSVHVQANWDASDPVAETRWVQGVADAHDVAHAIVAHADLTADNVDATLRAHCEFGNMRGVRQIIGHTDDPGCARPNPAEHPGFARGYALLARYALTFDLQVFPPQVEAFLRVARREPEVTVIVCHTGFPYDRSGEGISLWRRAMSSLAALPGACAKLSGPGMSMPDWTPERFGGFIHETIDLFGPERCMFASNVPPDAINKSYDEIYRGFYAWAGRYGTRECRQMFHDTAERVYRI